MNNNKTKIAKKYRYTVTFTCASYVDLTEIVYFCLDHFGNRSEKWNYHLSHHSILDRSVTFGFTNRSNYSQFMLTWVSDI